MSRYIGPKLKINRRLGILPGLTIKKSKKTNQKRIFKKKSRITDYGLRLKEKQKLKFNYGLTEKQLSSYMKKARKKKFFTSTILMQLLEMRLDNLCFTLGFAKTIQQARQLITHKHINVNKKIINIPSFQCHRNDIISISNKKVSEDLVKNYQDKTLIDYPSHIKFNNTLTEATILDYCRKADIQLTINELLVIEYYSRKSI
uniref:Ribosomal protein S4 n=1 Tax=Nitzschia sp. NIES-3576 TaxID=2083273 RepID=A0A2Z5ZAE6_9STRA|nr:ribosomal protein S4 [Nitzschia sp. NIES-3576]